jgi:Tfp pilus assembly protein PilX
MLAKTLPSKFDRPKRRGLALLLTLFLIAIASTLALSVINTETSQLTAARHAIDYERALYLANAGVQHACALLEQDSAWRGTVTSGSFPADGSYMATAADGTMMDVMITSSGIAGEVTRRVEAGVSL